MARALREQLVTRGETCLPSFSAAVPPVQINRIEIARDNSPTNGKAERAAKEQGPRPTTMIPHFLPSPFFFASHSRGADQKAHVCVPPFHDSNPSCRCAIIRGQRCWDVSACDDTPRGRGEGLSKRSQRKKEAEERKEGAEYLEHGGDFFVFFQPFFQQKLFVFSRAAVLPSRTNVFVGVFFLFSRLPCVFSFIK